VADKLFLFKAREEYIMQTQPRKKLSLTEVMPALHEWLGTQENKSFGIFQAIFLGKNYHLEFAVRALKEAKEGADSQTVQLAEMLVGLSQAQRRKLCTIWHFYDPGAQVVPPSRPARRKADGIPDF
jgi:hypothetical protein